MLKLLNKRRGQSTVEYAVLTAIIIGALLTIQVYVKRGVQGRLKSSSDDIGDQFSPGNTNALKTTKVKSKTKEVFGLAADGKTAAQGQSASIIDTSVKEYTNTTETSNIVKTDQEYWGK